MIVRVLFVAALAVSILGCDGSAGLHKLTGQVTRSDGSPLDRSRIIFHSKGSENFSATTDETGYYSAGSISGGEGITSGTYTITVMENRGDIDHPKPASINAKYNLVNKSDLEVVVSDAAQNINIVLDPP